MKYLKINKKNINTDELNLISDFFLKGKVVAHETDTVYGLACDATNVNAVRKVYSIKNKDKNKPLIVLVDGYVMLKKYFRVSGRQEVFLREVWPGAVTVILEKKEALPIIIANDLGAVAARLPKNDFLTKMITRVGRPIVSTSLNISGEPIVNDPKKIEGIFTRKKPDLIVDSGVCRKKRPSRIFDIADVNNIKRLR